MHTTLKNERPNPGWLISEIDRLSRQSIELCYHCHTCAASCPIIENMDYGPDRVLRMAALGEYETLLRSRDIWLCAGCFACAAHCPNGIEIPAVMDALRQLSISAGYPPGERDALLFHKLFLGVIQRLGRSHEAIMLGLFKVLSHTPFTNDLVAGAGLFLRGKVPLMPKRASNTSQIRQFFQRGE